MGPWIGKRRVGRVQMQMGSLQLVSAAAFPQMSMPVLPDTVIPGGLPPHGVHLLARTRVRLLKLLMGAEQVYRCQ